jgi:hypothetical protein
MTHTHTHRAVFPGAAHLVVSRVRLLRAVHVGEAGLGLGVEQVPVRARADVQVRQRLPGDEPPQGCEP